MQIFLNKKKESLVFCKVLYYKHLQLLYEYKKCYEHVTIAWVISYGGALILMQLDQ